MRIAQQHTRHAHARGCIHNARPQTIHTIILVHARKCTYVLKNKCRNNGMFHWNDANKNANANVNVHPYIHTYAYTHANKYVSTYIYICVYIYIYIYICMYVLLFIACMHMHATTHACVIYIYIYIYIYISLSLSPPRVFKPIWRVIDRTKAAQMVYICLHLFVQSLRY